MPPRALFVDGNGRIVVQFSDGTLGTSDPDGDHVARFSQLGSFTGLSVVPAPDGRYLASSDSQVVSIGQGNASMLLAGSTAKRLAREPFADHDTYIAGEVSNFGPEASTTVRLISLLSGHSTVIGTGDLPAGDPQAPGAFVASEAGQPVKSREGGLVTPDGAIVRLAAGAAPAVLANAAQLVTALGLPGPTPVTLTALPDPDGDLVAVEVAPLGGAAAPRGGVVVVARTGTIVGQLPGARVPLSWSPTGAALGFCESSPRPALVTWDPVTGAQGAVPLPVPPSSDVAPLWSPGADQALCSTMDAPAATSSWSVADLVTRKATLVTAPGFPLAWTATG